jgi:hypothetical protein
VVVCTCDLYTPTPQPQYPKNFKGLTNAAHTIVIQVLGTHNVNSSDNNIVVDGFIVSASLTEDTMPTVQYNKWKGTSSGSASGGSSRSNRKSKADAKATFYGTSVDWITAKGPAYGMAKVLIDGVQQGSNINLYNSTEVPQFLINFTTVGAGPHTIEVIPLALKDPASSSTKIVVDAFHGGMIQ